MAQKETLKKRSLCSTVKLQKITNCIWHPEGKGEDANTSFELFEPRCCILSRTSRYLAALLRLTIDRRRRGGNVRSQPARKLNDPELLAAMCFIQEIADIDIRLPKRCQTHDSCTYVHIPRYASDQN